MDATVKALLEQMQSQQKQNHEDSKILHQLMSQILSKEAATSTSSQKAIAKANTGDEFTLEALSSNITEFCYDADLNLTFDTWYARYEDLFEIDANKLDDAAKVRLLLRKLNTTVHNKYINYILPKHPRELNFKETVAKLKQLFGSQISIFNMRFNCLQITKDSNMDFITYTGFVNKQCENFKLNDLTLDQFKCLMFVMGLKATDDFDVRTKLLSKLDSESSVITLDILSRECQRIINLKTDTALIENPNNETQVHRLQLNKNYNNSTNKPNTPCWFCGSMHYARLCTYKKHKCQECNKMGHKEGYCFRPRNNNKQYKHNNSKVETNSIFTCNKISNSLRKYVTANINGVEVKLQLDTGSDITIVSEDTFKKLNINNLQELTQTARSATDELPLLGQFDCVCTFQDRTINTKGYVTPIQNLNVFGLDWLEALNLNDMSISNICKNIELNQGKEDVKLLNLRRTFSGLFDGKMGLCNKTTAHLVVKPGRQPVFRPPRPVAYAVRHLVEDELRRLQDANIITPVNYTDWAAPVVVIRKNDGRIRLCADFSTGLNDSLEMHQYPLPHPNDIFSKMANAQVFSHIDLADAFLQIEVNDKSKQLLTINTHMGLFRYNRMVFGVKTFPTIFQQIMDTMLAGLQGTAAYIDDIFVSGRNQEEHDQNLYKVLNSIQEYGFKLKFEKCKFSTDEIDYLGYKINRDGLKPNPARATAISNMPEPSNISELRSFLGAINFYGKFVDKMHKHRGPLDELLKANTPWEWNSKRRNSFMRLKEIIMSDLLLTHYDPNKKIIVAADASNYGLGACIFHECEDGSIKAISHASRSLTPAEKSYSQIEKEALALIFATTKFHKMIFGRKFKLKTDHKPLLTIFGKKTGISTHQANRLQRWATKLLAYDFEISFESTSSFGYADVLSRLINKQSSDSAEFVIASIQLESEVNKVLVTNIGKLPITHRMIKEESARDPILLSIKHYCQNGWPTNIEENSELHVFSQRKDAISIVKDCIMVGERVVVPKNFRKRLLKDLHKGHPGIERTKAIARSYVYWPGIDQDIKKFVQECNQCACAAKMPTKTPLSPWPIPQNVWERIHIDYAGPIDGYYFLVVVDALSKWPEIVPTKTISTQQTVNILSEIFSRHGLPDTIVSDNGTQFQSSLFKEFTTERGIKQLFSSPYYPMSNGQAERFVDTFKRTLKKLKDEGNILDNLQTFLQCYRSTPNRYCCNNKSPAELLYNRKMRIHLDLLHPPKQQDTRQLSRNAERMKQQFDKKHGVIKQEFTAGQKVYASTYVPNNKFTWKPGKIVERRGSVMYNVVLDNGKLIRAHKNQLRQRVCEDTSPPSRQQLSTIYGILDIGTPVEQQVTEPTQAERSDCNAAGQEEVVVNNVPHTPTLRRSTRQRRPVQRFTPPRN